MERFNQISAIGRPVDMQYPTNRAIAIVTLLVMGAGGVYRFIVGDGVLPAAGWGLTAGLTVFLTWALARELDPDYDYSAFVAAGLALVGALIYGPPGLLVLFWLLITLRIVNRSTGLPATLLDMAASLGLAAWLAYRGAWLFGLLTALAFALDGRLQAPQRRGLPFAGLTLVFTPLIFLLGPANGRSLTLHADAFILSSVAALLLLLVVFTTGSLRSVGDYTGVPLNPRRVQAAQLLALLALALPLTFEGLLALEAFFPIGAALAGVFIYRLYVMLSGGLRPS